MIRTVTTVCAASLAVGVTVAAQDLKVPSETLFAEQKCALCHSIAGKGNIKGPLDDVGSRLSDDEIRAWMTDAKGMTAKTKAPRKPEMRAYALSKQDVDIIVAYLSTLKKK